MEIDSESRTWLSKVHKIDLFLHSKYFANVPHVHISSGIWAIARDKMSQGQFSVTTEKARSKTAKLLRGFPLDIQHSSVFAPYCDVMLTERTMANFLKEWHKNSLSLYPFKVYSIDDETEFLEYLNGIESAMTEEMKEELKIVYDLE